MIKSAIYIAWLMFTPIDHSFGWYWFESGYFYNYQSCVDGTGANYKVSGMQVQCLPEGQTPK